ncbi:MAG: hypothetical protein QM727_12605 [Niabella sp.]
MEQSFNITQDDKTFNFSLDKHGTVWLIEEENGNTNVGQEAPITSLQEAKEFARQMLYATGRTKRP